MINYKYYKLKKKNTKTKNNLPNKTNFQNFMVFKL